MQAKELYTDESLLAALKKDDSAAFQILFNIFWQELYRAAYNRLRSQTEAEDLVQDIFTDIWERRHTLEITTSLKGYLHSALKFKIIRMVSRANLQKKALEHLIYRMSEMEETIMETMARSDIEATLAKAISDFPENMAKIFMLRSEDYTIREIAEALGLAEQTVKNNVSESLRRLKTILEKEHPDVSSSVYTLLVLVLLRS